MLFPSELPAVIVFCHLTGFSAVKMAEVLWKCSEMDSRVNRFFLFCTECETVPDVVMCGVGDLETVLLLVP